MSLGWYGALSLFGSLPFLGALKNVGSLTFCGALPMLGSFGTVPSITSARSRLAVPSSLTARSCFLVRSFALARSHGSVPVGLRGSLAWFGALLVRQARSSASVLSSYTARVVYEAALSGSGNSPASSSFKKSASALLSSIARPAWKRCSAGGISSSKSLRNS